MAFPPPTMLRCSTGTLRRLAAVRPKGAPERALVPYRSAGAARYLSITSCAGSTVAAPTASTATATQLRQPSLASGSTTHMAAAAAAATAALVLTCQFADVCAFTEGDEEPTLEQQREADWDMFMYKSIVPGEDDDDDEDDDDEDDEDDDEEEESEDSDESVGGPADEAEDGGADADDEQQIATLGQDEEGQTQPPTARSSASEAKDDESSGPADEAEDGDPDGDGIEGAADPYDNLPEEDEPTGCTICLINRQGPCRPFWRKFERCMKDHGDTTVGGGGDGDGDGDKKESDAEGGGEDGGSSNSSGLAEMCDKYMLPWLKCIQSYRNTYTLITNNFYQTEYVDALEKAVPESDRAVLGEETWSIENNLDLSLWNEYVAEEKEKLKKEAESMSDEEVEEAINLAKAYLKEKEDGEDVTGADADTSEVNAASEESSTGSELPSDPQLVAATTKIVLRDPISGHPIDMAYVRDQDGRVLGFEQFTNEKKMMRGEPIEGEEGNDDGEPKGAPLVANCGFHLQPGATTSFKVFALYREDVPCPEDVVGGDDNKSDEEKEPPKAEEKLYYTEAIPLVEGLEQ